MSMPITNIAFVFRKEDKEKTLNKIKEWDRGVDKEAERKSHPYFQTAMDIYRDAGKVEMITTSCSAGKASFGNP